MDINGVSQGLNTIITGAGQSTTGILGKNSIGDSTSSFEDLLNQIVNNSQNQTSNNDGTSLSSITSKDNIVNGLDSLSLQSQRAEQLQQMVMQQMMKIMAKQDTGSSSSIGTIESEDGDHSLLSSTKSNNYIAQLLQTIEQEQTNTIATNNSLNNSSQVNSLLGKVNL